MKESRRSFLKKTGIVVGTGVVLGSTSFCGNGKTTSESNKTNKNKGKTGKMKLSFVPYTLELKHTFTVASASRTTTPVVLTKIEYDGMTGYGEASMPPYLGESHDTVLKFLNKVDLGQFSSPFDLENILDYVDEIDKKNTAAKASVDIALHDLIGKIMGQPWYKIWGYDKSKTPNTSFTIGIDTPEMVKTKTKEAAEYKVLKVKMGRGNDKETVEAIRSITDKPICVDVNQGWKDKQEALDMCQWLNERNCLFVEQPMPKENLDAISWLSDESPLPIMADEAIQRLDDVPKLHGIYSGINIKLMKCTGMREAHKMLNVAKALDMKVMIGCMTETSCAISAASHLSPMADFADLDGALLISNDVYKGMKVIDGKITLPDSHGIGIEPFKDIDFTKK